MDNNSYFTGFNNKIQSSNINPTQSGFSLKEGNTALIEAFRLAKSLNLRCLYLKDESQNPSGSFKDRATAYQLQYWTAQTARNKNLRFCISSSGNAAISCAFYCNKFNLKLDIFISNKIDKNKLDRLYGVVSDKSIIHFSLKPKKSAFMFAKETGAINLIGSKDDSAIEGYRTLGNEILTSNISFDSIFMPVSSGTGILGVGKGTNYKYPLYCVQTTKVNQIAREFDSDFIESGSSLATAISVYYTPRKNEVLHKIKETKGYGFVISDEEIIEAQKDLFDNEGLNCSYDSALSIAGLKKGLKSGLSIKAALCILTGV